jgi:hypothetical protein
MKLSLYERLMLLGMLPREGNYVTLKVLNNLKLSLAPTEEEIKEWGIVVNMEKNQTTWAINGETEIPIGEKATDIIVAAIKKLDRENKLPMEAMGLYEKFIPKEET